MGKRLVAYYTCTEDEGTEVVGAEQLRGHLSAKLPDYMVPAAYVRMESWPLTANGKLDRKALPAPEADAYAVHVYEAPQTETEEVLAGIWAEVLKVERVGRRDNFFELGGHSLLAITVIERMRRMGMQVDVRVLFATPTLADLAAAAGLGDEVIEVPPNRIPKDCSLITPEMLPLCLNDLANRANRWQGDGRGGECTGYLPTGAVARRDFVPSFDGRKQ